MSPPLQPALVGLTLHTVSYETTAPSEQPAPSEQRINAAALRWSVGLATLGYSQVATAFYEFYQELGITALQALLLLNLVSLINVKGQQARMPFPSVKRLAKRLGSDERQVRRMLRALEQKQLLTRLRRPRPGQPHRSNLYDLSPLIHRLEQLCLTHPARMRSMRSNQETQAV